MPILLPPLRFSRCTWRDQGCVLTAIMLLGAAARLRQYFAATSYWHDEAYLLLNVFPKSFLELVGALSHDQAAPPLFLWLLRVCYLAGGPGELVMRLPALLASLGALALMGPLARALVGGKGWLWAVACAALSSALVYLSYQVKPYTTDVLIAETVLLTAYGCLTPQVQPGWRSASRIGLLAAACIGPWLSFPSVFVLAAACVALVGQVAWDSRPKAKQKAPTGTTRRAMLPGFFAASVCAVLLTTCTVLWLVAARHHNSPYQQAFWADDFVELSGPVATLAWLAGKLIDAGNYGVQGTGIPMALFVAVGLVSCGRRQPWLAVALAAPAAFACLAAALRHYPLGNRLLAFLLPCLWLLAAEGIAVVTGYLRLRSRWLAALPLLILLPAAVYTARYSFFAKPSVEFRQAFDYVRSQMDEADSLWVSQPEVFEVYHGRPPALDADSPLAEFDTAARRGRIWMLCHPPAQRNRQADEARRRIELAGAQATERLEFVHLDVTVFSPSQEKLAQQVLATERAERGFVRHLPDLDALGQ